MSRIISEMMEDMAIATAERQQELIYDCDLSICAIFNDLSDL